ncbi:MAG TPA: CBS domain-containing protein, partial [Clostridiaceae bacterium]|nr:CBS domain-containing protein [Clostridiaceae bacterium]
EERMNQARSTTQTVDQIMYRYPITITENNSTMKALSKMREHRVDSIFVTDEDNVLLGVVDVFDIDQRGRHNVPLNELMKTCVYVPEKTKIRDAIYSIMKLGYRNLPVVDEKNRITGIMTRAAVVESIYNSVWNEDETSNIKVPDVVQTTNGDEAVPPELQQVLEETESQEELETVTKPVVAVAGGDSK